MSDMQGQSYAGSIIASKKVGDLLSLDVSYEAKGKVAGCVEEIIKEMRGRLFGSGLCVSQYGFRGYQIQIMIMRH